MNKEKEKFKKSIIVPVTFIIIIWIVKLSEVLFDINFVRFGLYPRETFGLIGIAAAPLIHSNFEHLISNTFPLLFLGSGIFYFYPSSSKKVFFIVYFVTNILVWFFGRSSFHIGASGIAYGLVTFSFFSGVIRWDRRAIVLSLIVTFLYGSYTWGILPLDEKVSYESHLSGAVVGAACAFIFRKQDPYEKFAGMDENESQEENEINDSVTD